jgi:2,5-furandicarboxylate decarboxylase 1
VTVSDLRRLYEAALARGEALPISVSIGVHPIEILSAAYKAPPGVSELAIAGGLHGAPVPLARCRTIDVPAIADAEIVLEGALLPIGWTEDEGPFGEFAGMYGDLKHNPVFKVSAITHRRDAVFQLLQMPWENAWLGAAATEAQVWNVLRTAGVDVVDVAVTEGSACRWSVIASIRKRAAARTRCSPSWRCPTPSTRWSSTRTSTSTTPPRSSGRARSGCRPTATSW